MDLFLLKKIVTVCVLPPGIIILLGLAGVVLARKRLRLFLLGLTGVIFLVSIAPTRDLILSPLENAFPLPSLQQIKTADAYVYLGSGVRDTPEINGKGTLAADAFPRLFTTYTLYRMVKKPIILSGGPDVSARLPEAEVARKVLLELGVRPEDIITEGKSMDTVDNARFTAEICKKKGLKRLVLVTSAFHMKRSVLLFIRYFGDGIIPCPTAYRVTGAAYRLSSFIPTLDNMADISFAVKEYMGIVFYGYLRRS